jgi:hypothetical protein
MMIAASSAGLLRGLSWASVFLAITALAGGFLARRMIVRQRQRETGQVLFTIRTAGSDKLDARKEMTQRDGEQRDPPRDEEEGQHLDKRLAADRAEEERARRYRELAEKRSHGSDDQVPPTAPEWTPLQPHAHGEEEKH